MLNLLKPVLGGVDGSLHFSTTVHGQAQSNRVCNISNFVVFMISLRASFSCILLCKMCDIYGQASTIPNYRNVYGTYSKMWLIWPNMNHTCDINVPCYIRSDIPYLKSSMRISRKFRGTIHCYNHFVHYYFQMNISFLRDIVTSVNHV